MGDNIPLLQPAGFGRVDAALLGGNVRGAHHHHAVGKELNAHRPAHRDHRGCAGVGRAHRRPHGQHRRQQQPHKPRGGRPHTWSGFFIQIHSPPFHNWQVLRRPWNMLSMDAVTPALLIWRRGQIFTVAMSGGFDRGKQGRARNAGPSPLYAGRSWPLRH